MELLIQRTWNGVKAPPHEHVELQLNWISSACGGSDLHITINAPLHGDPAPKDPPGSLWELWNHEVVEIFIVGPHNTYIEIELGPHGHHLVLQLNGARNIVASHLPIIYSSVITNDRWRGDAQLGGDLIPAPPHRINAYAIHGVGQQRRHLAWSSVPGLAPDFHQLESFPLVELKR